MLHTMFSRTTRLIAVPGLEVSAAPAAAGELRLIDVREPAEFNAGHPAGATNVTGGYSAWRAAGPPTEGRS